MFCYYNPFKLLASKHDEFKMIKPFYNDFINFESIDEYVNNFEVIVSTLELCIKHDLQDLAM